MIMNTTVIKILIADREALISYKQLSGALVDAKERIEKIMHKAARANEMITH